MNRRHFLEHLAAASTLALPAISLTSALRANAADLKRRHKSAILLWMNGGPATIDIWDLKPEAPTGGEFKPISTTGDVQICEHLPLVAKEMKHLSIVRSIAIAHGGRVWAECREGGGTVVTLALPAGARA